jgi:cell division protein FtsZ
MAIEMIEEFDQGTCIKVIGVGGGGGNAVEHMIGQGVQGVEFIAANTDAQALNRSTAGTLVQLGARAWAPAPSPKSAARQPRARSTASRAPSTAPTCCSSPPAWAAAPAPARAGDRTCGQGDGHPDRGRGHQALRLRGPRRAKQADAGVAELEANVDSLIVVLNEKLLEVLGDDVTQDAAFAHANDVLKNAVGGISDIIHMDALVNVDFEDVKTVMSEPGKAMMGTAHGRRPGPRHQGGRGGRGLPAARRHRPVGARVACWC